MVRAAEESASMLANSISPDQCIKVLCPIIQSADYPINLAAIKMLTKVIDRLPKDGLHQMLPEVVPGLLQVMTLLCSYKAKYNVKIFLKLIAYICTVIVFNH